MSILPRDPTSNFDKTALKADLKLAGFEDCIAEAISIKVDERKSNQWTYDMGRQEAIKVAQILLKNSHLALDEFREGTLPNTGQQKQHPLAEKIADSTIT